MYFAHLSATTKTGFCYCIQCYRKESK